jgi:hypothetical protein
MDSTRRSSEVHRPRCGGTVLSRLPIPPVRALIPTESVMVALAVLALASATPAQVRWPTANGGPPGQATIYGRTIGAARFGFPLAAADVNGDGRADLILTPMNADSGPDRTRSAAGEAVIVLSSGAIAGIRDLALLDPPRLPSDITIVYGADAHDYLGTEVAAADLDGDGFADAIIGAQYGDGEGNARPNSGEVVIVWGGATIGGQIIDLADPPADSVTFVYAAHAGDRLGIWVSNGDFDGDGVADAILGADEADPGNSRPSAGMTYVVYGGAALRAHAHIDLAAPDLDVTAIAGVDPGDHSGATVRSAELNHDGAAEVLIGAGLARLSAQIGPTGELNGQGTGGGDGPDNACDRLALSCDIGEAYIVYGARGVRPKAIDLAHPPPTTVTIYGINPHDAWGEELYTGDFNGDGWTDVAIGALTADGPGNNRPNAGDLALVFGGPDLAGSVIDLAAPPQNTALFFGDRADAICGDTIELVDLDRDGRDDLVIACPDDRAQTHSNAGEVYVFFGSSDPLPAAIDLAAIPATLPYLLIDGAEDDDMLAYSISHGDVNGDGTPDLVLNVMGGDGFENGVTDAGDADVLDGIALSRFAGRLVPSTPSASVSPTPTASQRPPVTATASATAAPACAGDCNGDGTVTIDELIRALRIALREAPVATCAAADTDADGVVEIAELVAAVRRSLSAC